MTPAAGLPALTRGVHAKARGAGASNQRNAGAPSQSARQRNADVVIDVDGVAKLQAPRDIAWIMSRSAAETTPAMPKKTLANGASDSPACARAAATAAPMFDGRCVRAYAVDARCAARRAAQHTPASSQRATCVLVPPPSMPRKMRVILRHHTFDPTLRAA
jgi:hypothetical protein